MAPEKRTALITGSGRNIGRGCAKELAQAGFNIVLNGSSNRANCESVAEEIRALGSDSMIAMGDIGDKAASNDIAKTALDAFGRIDVLINNAAIRPAQPFLETTDDVWTRVMDVNFNAAIWLCRAFLPGMVEAGWGRIVNFTGMNAQRGTGGRPVVTASKHACWGLTKALAREFGPQGVTCNIISPGTFPDQDLDVATSNAMQELLKQTPVGRLGASADIAAIVGLLCSHQGGFINGQILQVNGGVET
jgi:3-oxoacyl-[acyl-carrier protein] reductase